MPPPEPSPEPMPPLELTPEPTPEAVVASTAVGAVASA